MKATARLAWILALLIPCMATAQTAEETASTTPDEGEETHTEVTVRVLGSDDLFTFRVGAGEFELDAGGRIALDGIKYGHSNDRDSGVELNELDFWLEGGIDPFRFRINSDLVGVDTPRNLWEAWVSFEPDPSFRLTVGQFRVALASEYATPEEDLPLFGYSFTSYLTGRYDMGIQADGDLLDSSLWYQATATFGHGFGLEGHRRSHPQFSIRTVGHPFRWFDMGSTDFFDGLFLGIGIAYSPDYDDPIIVANPLEQTVFRVGDLDADSALWNHLEAGYRKGPVRVGAERARGDIQNIPIPGGGGKFDADDSELGTWSVYGSWNITGETQVWERGRWQKPRSPDEKDKEEEKAKKSDSSVRILVPPGRWEIGARYSNSDLDRRFFEFGLTDYGQSTQEVRTFSMNLDWYPRETLRLGFGWVFTNADQDLDTFGGSDRDSSFLLRLDVVF